VVQPATPPPAKALVKVEPPKPINPPKPAKHKEKKVVRAAPKKLKSKKRR